MSNSKLLSNNTLKECRRTEGTLCLGWPMWRHSLVLLQGAWTVSVVLKKSPSDQFSVNTGVSSSSLFCSVHITQTDEQSASALLCTGKQKTLKGWEWAGTRQVNTYLYTLAGWIVLLRLGSGPWFCHSFLLKENFPVFVLASGCFQGSFLMPPLWSFWSTTAALKAWEWRPPFTEEWWDFISQKVLGGHEWLWQ